MSLQSAAQAGWVAPWLTSWTDGKCPPTATVRRPTVNAFNHSNLNMARQTDKHETFAGGVGLPYMFFCVGRMATYQFQAVAASRLTIFAVQDLSLATTLRNQEETSKPRGSTSQSLKRDSYPQKDLTRTLQFKLGEQVALPG